MKKIYTAGLIGCGRIGFSLGFDKKREQPASHTMALKNCSRIKIISAADTDSKKLERWKKYCGSGVSVYPDAKSLLEAELPDLVVVAVNEDAHLETAIEVIKSRPRLLILEKPVALNMEQVLKIKTAAQEYSVPVLVNHERRFAKDYATAASYIKRIGQIQNIRANLCSGLRVYLKSEESTGAYSLLHDGTHLVDIVYYFLEQFNPDILLEKPLVSACHWDENSALRNLNVHYKTKICPDVELCISGRSRFFEFGIDILGTEGRIEIGNGYARFYKRKESKLYSGFYSLSQDKSVKKIKKTAYFSNMIQNAVDFLDGKSQLKSNLETGLKTLTVLEDLIKIIKESKL